MRNSAIERVAGAVWRDGRDAWRSLRGAPGFTTAALILLAFAIGLNTAVFTVINAVLFRPLAVRAPHELAFVSRTSSRGNESNLGAYEDVLRFAANANLFTGGAGVELDTANARIGDDVVGLTGERVSANYFDVLGVAPRLGRTLVPASTPRRAPNGSSSSARRCGAAASTRIPGSSASTSRSARR